MSGNLKPWYALFLSFCGFGAQTLLLSPNPTLTRALSLFLSLLFTLKRGVSFFKRVSLAAVFSAKLQRGDRERNTLTHSYM